MSTIVQHPERLHLIGPNASMPVPTPLEIVQDAQARYVHLEEEYASLMRRVEQQAIAIRAAQYNLEISVSCSYCGAEVGAKCIYPEPMPNFYGTHTSRLIAAHEHWKEQGA